MKKILAFLCAVTFVLGLATSAAAATVVAGYTFDDNAFADTLISSSGSFSVAGTTLESALTDSDLTTWAYSWSEGAYVELGFTDNSLVNGVGADLALFEIGIADYFDVSVTIGGMTKTYGTTDTGYDAGGYDVNVALINLDDFGLASGALLSSIVIGMSNTSGGQVPTLAVAGAYNSGSAAVPEPATMILLGLSLFGLAGLRKRL